MNQYTTFFNSNRQLIEQSSADLVNAAREKACVVFEKKGFPVYQSEDYQHTNIAELLGSDFGFYLDYTGPKVNPHKVFHCNVPNLASSLHFIVNGHFHEEKTKRPLPENVFSGSLNAFAEKHPELFKRYYNQQAGQKGDGLAAFNTMFVQDGYVLYVPKNVIIDNPIQLTNISGGNIDSLINRRILVIIESGAQAKLLVCDHTNDDKSNLAATQISEIYVGENAVFDFYELEESSKKTIRLTSNFVEQAASSNVMINNITLSNGVTRNNYQVDLMGEGAETYLYGMAIADDKEQVDNFSVIRHLVPRCHSNELFKYVLEGEAIGTFSGRIVVEEAAQKTEAYQTNRNMLGGNACRMYSKPQLEIYADDVKCSHGMSTGQLDETALFYMRQRGIPEAEARMLLKFAFTNDIIKGIRLDGLRERLNLLVEKRFRGELIKCQGCI